MTHRLAALCLALAAAASAAPPETSSVAYPTGYRKWAFVKSMVIYSDKHPLFAEFGGMHHVYANAEAMRALVKGGTFPDGSVLVFDLLEAKDENGAWVAGSRKLVGVMEKNRARFKTTGGWGFEAFKGASQTERTVTDAAAQCFSCHQKQKDNDFVFSGYLP
jgi:Cytochrome P460